jgi:hypothetical protein
MGMTYQRPNVDPVGSKTRPCSVADAGPRAETFLAALAAIDPSCPFPRAKLKPDILPADVLPWLALFQSNGDRFDCRLFGTGLTRGYGADMTGRSLDRFWTGERPDVTMATYRRALTQTRPTVTLTEFEMPEGRMRYARVLVPLADEAGRPGWVLSLIDLKTPIKFRSILEVLADGPDHLRMPL